MNTYRRVALFGGIYNNHLALASAIAHARRRGAEQLFCLGDLGAFGPNPDKVFPLLIDAGVQTLQGNYDHSIGNDLADCQCGYTDPADNYYARLSYQYTYRKTSPRWRPWLKALPTSIRFQLQGPLSAVRGPLPDTADHGQRTTDSSNPQPATGNACLNVLCCHGSPRKTNEFLWESTTPTHLLEQFADTYAADILIATHTGLPWMRRLSRNRLFINCGVLGRPANDGTPRVGYTLLDAAHPDLAQYIPLDYDHEALAAEMQAEHLPDPFIDTIRTGWWSTCLEILPEKERRRGRY